MSAIPTQIANSFDFWLSFTIGGAIVIALMGFAMVGHTMWNLRGATKEKRGQQRRKIAATSQFQLH